MGGGQGVDGQQSKRGLAVHEDHVVLVEHWTQHPLEGLLAGDLVDELDLCGGQVDVGRDDVQPLHRGLVDDRADVRAAGDEEVVDGGVELVGVDAQAGRGRSLGVEVDDEDLAPQLGQGRAEVDRRRGLADAALLVAHGDDPSGSVRLQRSGNGEVLLLALVGAGVVDQAWLDGVIHVIQPSRKPTDIAQFRRDTPENRPGRPLLSDTPRCAPRHPTPRTGSPASGDELGDQARARG